jgi:hypothetical protein
MAFIGNTVQNQGFTPAIDYFNGNGVTVTFTLSRPIASVAQVIVAVDNVIQNPSSAFGVVGNSITFTSAPLSGTNNIWVEYTSLITTYQGISQDPTVIGDIRATGGYLAEGDFGNSFIDGNLIDYVTGAGRFTVGELDDIVFYHGGTGARSEMMDLYYAGGAKIYGTTALTIPVGTTAQRPTGATGMTRFNTTTGYIEYYNGSAWAPVVSQATTYAVSALVVAGGGPGGATNGGGGGAGGVLFQQVFNVSSNVAYTITVGAGGSASLGGTSSSGSNSVFGSLLAYGGGAGDGANSTDRRFGGSGSGGRGEVGTAGGAGTLNQGNAGGTGQVSPRLSAGGGGAGAVGQDGSAGGAGGSGTNTYSSWATATSTGASGFYAGGGGGGTEAQSRTASGGSGGGGASGNGSNGVAGTANTGGGGGGGSRGSGGGGDYIGGNGGSGIVIIAYQGSQRGTGGTVTSSGGYTYHTFTSSGTYTA